MTQSSHSIAALTKGNGATIGTSTRMTDNRIRIWNILHDGEITAIEGEDSGTLTMFVSIPYLRRRMPPLGDSFVITLSGLSHIEFRDFDGATSSLRSELDDTGSPEILSTESDSMPVLVNTTLGFLHLDFQDISFALDTGQSVEFDAIVRVAEEYWSEWQAKAE